jgi:hypothetical protein
MNSIKNYTINLTINLNDLHDANAILNHIKAQIEDGYLYGFDRSQDSNYTYTVNDNSFGEELKND